MATAEQIKALVKSHAEGDQTRFCSVALQVAAHAARKGHTRLARDLRDLVDEVKATAARRQRAAGVSDELAGLLIVSAPKVRLSAMVLDDKVRARLQRVIREQRQQHQLREFGLQPRRKLLLAGPPGTGKTMTAAALAGELGLPLYTLRLDGLITKYLGETAAKLRLVFDAICATRAVYLFDEFDALGGTRAAGNDVGEIRRVLNSLLQFLESDALDGLVVCATNLREMLDRALFRRFDDVIEYSLPDPEQVESLLRTRLALLETPDLDWEKVRQVGQGLSYADLARACDDAAKSAILDGSRVVTTDAMVRALQERRAVHRDEDE